MDTNGFTRDDFLELASELGETRRNLRKFEIAQRMFRQLLNRMRKQRDQAQREMLILQQQQRNAEKAKLESSVSKSASPPQPVPHPILEKPSSADTRYSIVGSKLREERVVPLVKRRCA